MKHKLGELPYQIDFKTNHTPSYEVMEWIKSNSTRVQHLLDEEPRISRWWFENLSKALEGVVKIQNESPDTDYRIVCQALDGIFIQHGEF